MPRRKAKKLPIDRKRHVSLFGQINQDHVGRVMEQMLDIAKRDRANGSNGKPIWLSISSHGGEEEQVIALREFLRIHNIKVNTVGIGTVSSAAVYILQLGEIRYITKHCFLMIHEGSIDWASNEQFSVQKRVVAIGEKTGRICMSLVARRSGKPIAEIRKRCREVSYFDAIEAKKFGLVDRII